MLNKITEGLGLPEIDQFQILWNILSRLWSQCTISGKLLADCYGCWGRQLNSSLKFCFFTIWIVTKITYNLHVRYQEWQYMKPSLRKRASQLLAVPQRWWLPLIITLYLVFVVLLHMFIFQNNIWLNFLSF